MASDPQGITPGNHDGLLGKETFWRDHYTWLLEQGYQLRPRYAPDWKPSWRGSKKRQSECEDGHPLPFVQINDALQVSTGSRVALKMLFKRYNPLEEEIFRYLTSEDLLKDKRNICVPLLDVLNPPVLEAHGEDIKILVMPQLRSFRSPQFDTVGEVLECLRQILEGLQFLHEHHVAHRDLCGSNFMMAWEGLCPNGYHPCKDMRNRDLTGPAKFYTRTQRPTKYFIIDFGLSRRYDADNAAPLEDIILGGDKTVPEFQDTSEPQNPFQTDIYYVGSLIRRDLFGKDPTAVRTMGYRGLDFLSPLVDKMTQRDPACRPTIDEVVKEFTELVASLGSWKLRSRTPSRRSNVFTDFAHFLGHWRRRVTYIAMRTPALPRLS